MTRRAWCAFAVALFTVPVLLAASTAADKAGIPMDRNVEFDESAQNAIAAWNGEKECLILSTDLQSVQPGRLMEMLPLPSAPYDIQPANVSAFKTVIKLYNEKMQRLDVSPDSYGDIKGVPSGEGGVQEFEGIEVVFSSSVGLHNVTVVKLENNDHFIQWTRSFAASQGVSDFAIDERLNRSVADHLNRSISYFVFDIVTVSAEKRTAEPLAYFFNTTFLYYPLRVTYDALPDSYWERNRISVFLVAGGVVRGEDSYVPGVYFTGGVHEYIEFSTSELRRVFGPLGALFKRNAFVAHLSGYMHVHSYTAADVKDVVLRASDFRRPSDDELRAQYERADYLRAIEPLSPSIAYYLLRGVHDPEYAPPAPWLALILLGIFAGPIALGLMFKSILERGDQRSALWISWLLLYVVSIFPIMGVLFLASVLNEFEANFLVVFLTLLLPLVVVLSLGERFKHRPAGRKGAINGVAFGMAAAQVAVMVFVPTFAASMPLGAVCFPILGLIGIAVIVLSLLARRQSRHPAVWIPPSPPAR